ncbi:hypothetical protein KKC91_08355 [bacterium]|nr:hypothetical protein [bacterium]
MDFKQSTIGEILDSEREMVLEGAKRYEEYFVNASDFNHLLNEFLKTIAPDRSIFAAFLSQIRKHHMLALFSAVRLHRTQAMMDMRQVLEAGACAAYAIANPDLKDFANFDNQGIINPSDALTKKRYKWLEKNYKTGSDAIKNMKSSINKRAHSNIVDAQKTFKIDVQSRKFETPFFDIEDDYHVKTDLWMIGNVVMDLMDLFYNVNKERDVIKFIDDFIPRLKSLKKQNDKLKQEMMGFQRRNKN